MGCKFGGIVASATLSARARERETRGQCGPLADERGPNLSHQTRREALIEEQLQAARTDNSRRSQQ